MPGLSCGSARATTFQGSQWHDAPNWLNDPLHSLLSNFMSTVIPAGFGPLSVPFLSAITQLAGTGYNSLAAVPTAQLPIPFAVDILVGNVPQRWFLVAGAYPATPGTLQPNDANPVTNNRYWVQLE